MGFFITVEDVDHQRVRVVSAGGDALFAVIRRGEQAGLRYCHFLGDTSDHLLLNRIQFPRFLDEMRLMLAATPPEGAECTELAAVIEAAEAAARIEGYLLFVGE
ncbi:MAG: hypothetical protein M3400_13340 [Actinomycetota bacterium]|nr:hypothetical protein [Actinomycetota bacterium]